MFYIITEAVEARRQGERFYGTFLHIYQTTLRHTFENLRCQQILFKITNNHEDFYILPAT